MSDDPAIQTKTARLRSGLYRILGLSLIQPPAPELIALWQDSQLQQEMEILFSPQCCKELARGLAENGLTHRRIKLAYDAIFSVPIKGQSVTPYESVYREDHFCKGKSIKLLMGDSAAAVQQCYRSAGLEPPLDARELPDHVGLELLFLSGLCGQEAAARAHGNREEASAWRRRQYRFLREHLGLWAEPLAEDIRRLAGHDFIKAVAAMMVELVNQDLEYLKGAVSGPRNQEYRHEQRPGAA